MQLTFTYNLQDIWHGTWLRAWNDTPWIQFLNLLMPLLGVMLLLLDVMVWAADNQWSATLAALGAFCLLYRTSLFHALVWFQVRRYIKRNPGIFQETWVLDIEDSGLKLTNKGATTPIPWQAFVGYRTGKHNILLYFRAEIALNIPRRAFTETSPATDFLALLKNHRLKPY